MRPSVSGVCIRLVRHTDFMVQEALRSERHVSTWLRMTNANGVRAIAFVKSDDPEVHKFFKGRMSSTSAKIGEIQKKIKAMKQTDEVKRLFGIVGQKRLEYKANSRRHSENQGSGQIPLKRLRNGQQQDGSSRGQSYVDSIMAGAFAREKRRSIRLQLDINENYKNGPHADYRSRCWQRIADWLVWCLYALTVRHYPPAK